MKSETATAMECLQYALSLPTAVVITGIDRLEYIDQACEAARTYQAMTPEAIRTLRERTRPAARGGRFEPFKTTSIFDGTASNPEWLGEEPERFQALMPD